jgi:thiol:disulfide interchange protein
VVLSLLAVAIVFVWVPLPTVVFLVLFGVLQVALVGAVIYVGYKRRDLRITTIASLALLVIIGVR